MAWQREFLAVVFCHICKFHLCSELPACCWLAPMFSAPCYSQPWPNSFTRTDESLKILLILNYTLKQYISPKYIKQSPVSAHTTTRLEVDSAFFLDWIRQFLLSTDAKLGQLFNAVYNFHMCFVWALYTPKEMSDYSFYSHVKTFFCSLDHHSE